MTAPVAPGTVSGLINKFERQKYDRVVMSGHGYWFTADGEITVPAGITIHFYVAHGDLTNNVLGMAVENRFASTDPPTPLESFTAGQTVKNYRLGFGSRLDLAGNLDTYKYEWITVDQIDRLVALSVLFRDPRCKAPCTIHWAACREIRAGATGPGGLYITRDLASLVTTGKSLDFVDSSGVKTTHTVTMPGRVKIPGSP
jgi:hypothetical protein